MGNNNNVKLIITNDSDWCFGHRHYLVSLTLSVIRSACKSPWAMQCKPDASNDGWNGACRQVEGTGGPPGPGCRITFRSRKQILSMLRSLSRCRGEAVRNSEGTRPWSYKSHKQNLPQEPNSLIWSSTASGRISQATYGVGSKCYQVALRSSDVAYLFPVFSRCSKFWGESKEVGRWK